LSTVVFHVVNFGSFSGEPMTDGSTTWTGRLTLSSDEWDVVLEAPTRLSDIHDELRIQGGYSFTHVGRLSHRDGSSFTSDQAKPILEALRLLLSFAKGAWVGIVLPEGRDFEGTIRWQSWDLTQIDPWDDFVTWYHSSLRQSLPPLFKALMDRWADEDFQRIVSFCIGWYRQAITESAAEVAVVSSQVALERLGWAALVQDRAAISHDGFLGKEGQQGLAAHDRLRLLLTWASIPTTIPRRLPELARFANERQMDGASVFTLIRNDVVHPPRRKKTRVPFEAAAEASYLGLWYLELALLWWLGYRGDYRDRSTYSSEPRPVPWK
jgi:hypothetical protein